LEAIVFLTNGRFELFKVVFIKSMMNLDIHQCC